MLNRISQTVSQTANAANSSGVSFGQLAGAMAAAKVVGEALETAFTGIKNAIEEGIQAAFAYNSAIEQITVGYNALTGSVEEGTAAVQAMTAFASSNPLDTRQALDFGRAMLIAGQNSKELVPDLRAVGDIAATMGRMSEASMARITYALQEVGTMGQVNGITLRMLGRDGIPIVQTLADAYGVTGEQIHKMASEGKISADMLFSALRHMDDGNSVYAGGLERYANTAAGAWQILTTNLQKANADALKPLTDEIGHVIVGMSKFAQSQEFNAFVAGAAASVKVLVDIVKDGLTPALQGLASGSGLVDLGTKIANFAAGAVGSFDFLVRFAGTVFANLGDVIGGFAEMAGGEFAIVGDRLGAFGSSIDAYFGNIGTMLGGLGEVFGGFFEMTGGEFAISDGILGAWKDTAGSVFQAVGDMLKVGADAFQQWVAVVQQELTLAGQMLGEVGGVISKAMSGDIKGAFEDAGNLTKKFGADVAAVAPTIRANMDALAATGVNLGDAMTNSDQRIQVIWANAAVGQRTYEAQVAEGFNRYTAASRTMLDNAGDLTKGLEDIWKNAAAAEASHTPQIVEGFNKLTQSASKITQGWDQAKDAAARDANAVVDVFRATFEKVKAAQQSAAAGGDSGVIPLIPKIDMAKVNDILDKLTAAIADKERTLNQQLSDLLAAEVLKHQEAAGKIEGIETDLTKKIGDIKQTEADKETELNDKLADQMKKLADDEATVRQSLAEKLTQMAQDQFDTENRFVEKRRQAEQEADDAIAAARETLEQKLAGIAEKYGPKKGLEVGLKKQELDELKALQAQYGTDIEAMQKRLNYMNKDMSFGDRQSPMMRMEADMLARLLKDTQESKDKETKAATDAYKKQEDAANAALKKKLDAIAAEKTAEEAKYEDLKQAEIHRTEQTIIEIGKRRVAAQTEHDDAIIKAQDAADKSIIAARDAATKQIAEIDRVLLKEDTASVAKAKRLDDDFIYAVGKAKDTATDQIGKLNDVKTVAEGNSDDVKTRMTTNNGLITASFDTMKDHVDAVSTAIRNMPSPSINVPGGGPAIPKLGTGGIVSRPTLAIVGEVPEAVVPLSGLSNMAGGYGAISPLPSPNQSYSGPYAGGGNVTFHLTINPQGLMTGTPEQLAAALTPAIRDEITKIANRDGVNKLFKPNNSTGFGFSR